MLRAILGVIVGYVAMALAVLITFTAAYLAMGTDRAFQPGSYEVSSLWIAVALPLSAVAALVGGWVCAVIARGSAAPKVLAGIVVVLGLLMAVGAVLDDRPSEPRTGEVSNVAAMKNVRQPLWVTLLTPVIEAAGVLAGASLIGGRGAAARDGGE